MSALKYKTMLIRIRAASIALIMTFAVLSIVSQNLSAQSRKASGTTPASKRMPDGKLWTTHNLNLNMMPAYCYEAAESNCSRYGR